MAQEAFRDLRLERAQIAMTAPRSAGDDFILLDQLATYFAFSRMETTKPISEERLAAFRRSLLSVSTPYDHWRLIQMLAVQGRAEDAQGWVERMRKSLPPETFRAMANDWVRWHERNPSVPDLAW